MPTCWPRISRRILPAKRLIVAGGTAGVLDADGQTMAELPVDAIDAMMASGVAHSGMVAKLGACRLAFASGVTDISIVAGRGVVRLRGPPPRATPGSSRRARRRSRTDSGDERMTTATTNVMALETEHVLQVYKRNPVVFERGRGCRLFDADGPRLSRSDLWRRRRGARPRATRVWPPPSRNRRRRCSTRRTSTSTRCRGSSRRGCRTCRGCRARSSATAARKRSRRA